MKDKSATMLNTGISIRIFLVLLCITSIACAQEHQLILKDSETNQPIADANLSYANTSEGTISNSDGVVRVVSKDSITISHLGYITKRLGYADYSATGIIYLQPTATVLDEVVVSAYDLKAKLKAVLENYSSLYVQGERTYSGTYKESFRTHDTLMRLFQVQMQWRNADYELVFEKSWTKQNQIQFTSKDYSKLTGIEGDFQVSVGNGDFLKSLFLNHYLYYIIYETEEIQIQNVDKVGQTTRVTFSAPMVENGIIVRDYNNCEVHLDNTTGAVLKLKTTLLEKGDTSLEKVKFPSGKRGSTKTKAVTREISFVSVGDKLRLSKMQLQIAADIEIEEQITPVVQEQVTYFTNIMEGDNTDRSAHIKLTKEFFYRRIPQIASENPVIVLTKEEASFVDN